MNKVKNFINRDIKRLLIQNGFQEGEKVKDDITNFWSFTKPGFVTRETTDLGEKVIRIEIFQSMPELGNIFSTFISVETMKLFIEIKQVLNSHTYSIQDGQWGNEMIIHINKEQPFKEMEHLERALLDTKIN